MFSVSSAEAMSQTGDGKDNSVGRDAANKEREKSHGVRH